MVTKDGKIVTTNHESGKMPSLNIWDAATLSHLHFFDINCEAICLLSGNRLGAISVNGDILAIDLHNYHVMKKFTDKSLYPYDFITSLPQGLVATGSKNEPSKMLIWDLRTGKCISRLAIDDRLAIVDTFVDGSIISCIVHSHILNIQRFREVTLEPQNDEKMKN